MTNNDLDALGQSPEFSEDRLALNFTDRFENRLRYVAALGKWFIWDGARWKIDDTLLARDQVRVVCRDFSSQCNEQKLAKLIASAKTVAAVERLASTDRRIAATIAQFDSAPWLLNTPAGTIDLRTGELRKHLPSDYITKLAGGAPDPAMQTPVWHQFLDRVTGGDVDLILFLRRMAGYALTGSTQEHALFFLYGLGANGKSTFLNAITAAAGDYHCTTPIETFTASTHDRHPTELAGLRGARLITATETEEGRRWAESRIKALTGGDRISARFMRQDFFEFTPAFKLVIAGNHKPGLRSVDEAIRRRFNLVPFTVTIPLEERDDQLADKLKLELPGILAWMIEGCLDWQENGLGAPKVVTDATAEYLQDEDALSAWIDECAVRTPQGNEMATDLFTSYSQWASRSGEPATSLKKFCHKLADRGFERVKSRNGRHYNGIRLEPAKSSLDCGWGEQRV
jgi:putative DNA primase/helicase